MEPIRIHKGKTDRNTVRRHYIPEWAAKYGKRKADLARATGADKSLVGKWFEGTVPSDAYLEQLAALFETEPESLLRHPDDDWVSRWFRQLDAEQKDRARQVLPAIFPKKTGTK